MQNSTSRLFSIAYRIFGGSVQKKDLSALSLDLRRARIPIPAAIYLSTSRLIASFLAIFGGFIGVLAGYAIVPYPDLAGFILILSAGSLGAILFYLLTMRTCLVYPTFRMNTRKMKIERGLLHGINYLYAMAKGGMGMIDAFRSLHRHEEVYGECAVEAGYIVRDVEYFGLDLKTALMRASKNTPSEKFRDFIEGLISVMNTGGSIENYLATRSEQYQELAEEDNNFFLDTLGMLAECYVTVFVAAPLFLITIVLVLGMLKSGTLLILAIIVYVLIPIGTSLFIILLDAITTRTDEEAPSFIRLKKLNVFDDVHTIEGDGESIVDALKWYAKVERIRFFLRSPFRFFIEKPYRSFYISLPLTLIYLLELLHPSWQIPTDFDRSIFYATILLLLPYSLFFEIRAKRIRDIERMVPEFLRRLKSINETGLHLVDSIRVMIRSNMGVLTSEIVRVASSIEWGNTVGEALRKLEVRVKTGALSRAITLLVDADRATGNLRDILSIAALNAEIMQRLRERRSAAMSIYLIIVYITFAVFLFTIYIITTKFLGGMPKIPIEGAEEFLSVDYDLSLYEKVLFHGSLLQGFFSGIVGGQMSSGNPYSGIKHAIVMMIAAYLVFVFLIWGEG